MGPKVASKASVLWLVSCLLLPSTSAHAVTGVQNSRENQRSSNEPASLSTSLQIAKSESQTLRTKIGNPVNANAALWAKFADWYLALRRHGPAVAFELFLLVGLLALRRYAKGPQRASTPLQKRNADNIGLPIRVNE